MCNMAIGLSKLECGMAIDLSKREGGANNKMSSNLFVDFSEIGAAFIRVEVRAAFMRVEVREGFTIYNCK